MCYHRHPPNLPPNAPNSPTLFSIKTTTGRRATRTAGLAMFSVLKAGFVFSGKAGSGLVIARLPDGSWSAPSCIATGGVGWGLQIGADITDFVIVLNSEEAVRAFALGGNVTIGGNVSAAAGPIGTGGAVQATLAHPAPMFSYSKSKGAHCETETDGCSCGYSCSCVVWAGTLRPSVLRFASDSM